MDQGSPVPTTPSLVSLEAFHGIIWGGFALCVIAFTSRVAIRAVCFRRLFVEDYIMLAALVVLLVTTILGQLFVGYIYKFTDVSNGAPPSPQFPVETSKGLRSFAALTVLNYIGIWLIKLNFLLFFRRLGNHVDKYRYFWWFVLFFNLAAGATCIGLIDFPCVLPPVEVIFATCNGTEPVTRSYTASKVSASLDAVGDGLIIAFPIWILWGCKLSLQKKLALSGIFSLVAFTIAVSIIRGSIFGGVYHSISKHETKQLNVTWIWFWFNIEFIVAFTVGCLVSFRALFGRKGGSAQGTDPDERCRRAALQARSKTERGPRGRFRRLQEQLTTTFMTWEATMIDSEDRFGLPRPATGKLSLDFETGHRRSDASSSTELTIGETDDVELAQSHVATCRY
ncbi:hypothetical protein F4802DRAFT_586427 [Xylaria palmicola]|nr:hypothetical protein F4802DRAFT_586427 [Xylaria palmicola]